MPKLKTQKSISKRLIITKKGKIKKRMCGQDHFNARESGNTTRKKRRDVQISNRIGRNAKRLMVL